MGARASRARSDMEETERLLPGLSPVAHVSLMVARAGLHERDDARCALQLGITMDIVL